MINRWLVSEWKIKRTKYKELYWKQYDGTYIDTFTLSLFGNGQSITYKDALKNNFRLPTDKELDALRIGDLMRFYRL